VLARGVASELESLAQPELSAKSRTAHVRWANENLAGIPIDLASSSKNYTPLTSRALGKVSAGYTYPPVARRERTNFDNSKARCGKQAQLDCERR
jgi:hypothetical protein